jgi:hypothetical protein
MMKKINSLIPILDNNFKVIGKINIDIIQKILNVNNAELHELENFFEALDTLSKDWQYALFSLHYLMTTRLVGNSVEYDQHWNKVQSIMYEAAQQVQTHHYQTRWKILTSQFCRDLAVNAIIPKHSLRTTLNTCLFLTGDAETASVENMDVVFEKIDRRPDSMLERVKHGRMYQQATATWLGRKINSRFEGPSIQNYLALDKRPPTRGGPLSDHQMFLRDVFLKNTLLYPAFQKLRNVVLLTMNEVHEASLSPRSLPSSSQTSERDKPLPGAASVSERDTPRSRPSIPHLLIPALHHAVVNPHSRRPAPSSIPSRPPAPSNPAPRQGPSVPPAEGVAPIPIAASLNDEGFNELKHRDTRSSISLPPEFERGDWAQD